MPPPAMGRGRPTRWWSGRPARRLGSVAVSAALVFTLCCFVGSRCARAGGAFSFPSDPRRMAAAAAAGAGARRPGGDQAVTEVQQQQQGEDWERRAGVGVRRLLSGGPGSHPPRCTSKCGSCSPCYPVHVSVPPGVLVTTEYYPEAWRCKCRNQLYMP